MKVVKKSFIVLLGTFISALGIALFLQGQLGYDPISTFLMGILNFVDIKFGTSSQIFNVSLLLLVFLLDRKQIGFGSALNAVFLGFFLNQIDRFGWVQDIPLHGLILSVIGPILLGIGVGVYLSAQFGSGAAEGLMIYCAEKLKISIKVMRIIIDGSLVLIGFLLGAEIGIGTILGILLIGPAIEYTLKAIFHFFPVKPLKEN